MIVSSPQHPPPILTKEPTLHSLEGNVNMAVHTQITERRLTKPLDLSDVTDKTDRARLERVDRLMCSLSNDMPLLVKHKPRVTPTTYILLYDWDDSVFEFDLFGMIQRFSQTSFIQKVLLRKNGLRFIIAKDAEIQLQGNSEDTLLRPRKRLRSTDEDDIIMDSNA